MKKSSLTFIFSRFCESDHENGVYNPEHGANTLFTVYNPFTEQIRFCIDKSITFCYTNDMSKNISGIVVEWDENKNSINIQKHGISFETAALVFADEERIEYYDKLHSLDEDRYVVIGCVQGILYVVYTMRNEAARIISARMATNTERKIYYGE